MREDDANVIALHERLRTPHIGIPTTRTAVQVAADAGRRIVERRKLDLLAVQLEFALGNTVAVTADDAAPVGVAVIPTRRRVKTHYDILHLALAIGGEKTHNLAAVVADFKNHAAGTVKCVFFRLFAVFCYAKIGDLKRRFCHDSFSLWIRLKL